MEDFFVLACCASGIAYCVTHFNVPIFYHQMFSAISWHQFFAAFSMALNQDIVKKLGKKYEPLTMINMRMKEKDVAFKTDKEGNAALLFIGKLKEDGSIKGERYVRTLKYDNDGKIIKDHWELKGKAT